ncbi:MAG: hypothetical protein HN380_12990 [Victivallales bacterium]|nr:hypothetical protein [Victivallales bacterium]
MVDLFMRCLHFAVRMMATPVARSCGHGVTARSRQRGGWRSLSFRLLASTVFLGTMLSPLGTGAAPAAANSAIQNPVSFRDPIATPDSFTAVLGGHTIDLSWNLNPSGDDVLVAWSTSPVFGIPAGSYSVGDPIAGGGTVLYSGDATAAPHTGLAPGTTYYYTAWSVIAGPAFSAGVACSSSTGISVPYTEDFENGGAIPAGWTQERATGTADWSFEAGGHDGHPAGAHGGSYNAFLYHEALTDNKTRLFTPAIDFGTATENAQLTFWHCMESWDGDQEELRVFYRTSTVGSWTLLATYTTSVPAWRQRTVSLPEPGGSYYLAFEGNGKWGYGVCIDDVQVTGEDPGITPGNFAAVPISASRIDLSWNLNTPGDDVLVAWSTTPVFGSPVGAYSVGDSIPGGGTVLSSGAATAVSHTGLASGTTYYYTAWSVFPGPSFSVGIACSAPTTASVPYTEGFENGGVIPAGWTQERTTGVAEWNFQAGGQADLPAGAHGGSYNARLYCESALEDNKTKLVTPLIEFGAATENAQLTFWHCMLDWSGYVDDYWVPGRDQLRVFYRTSGGGSWTLLASYTTSVVAWTQQTVDLPNPGDSYYLAFEGNARWGRGVCIDDIQVTAAEPGITPGTFAATPAGVSRIGLSWNLNVDSDDVLVAWSTTPTFGTPSATDPVGQAIPGGGTVLYRGGATAVSHTGLAAATPYYYKAWSVLPGAALSAGVVCSASTDLFLSVPFTEGFENGGTIPAGWTQQQVTNTADWTFESGGQRRHPNRAHGGSYNAQLSYYSTAEHRTKLITPMIRFPVDGGNAQLKFWHCMADWEGKQDELRVLYRTSASGPWTPLATYTSSVASWTQRVLDLPEPGESYYLAFEGNARYGYGVCIDDVEVTAKKDQAITFDPLSPKTYGDADYDLGATASSGLAVTYVSSDPGTATITGNDLHIVGAGTSTITASQPGNDLWSPAPLVEHVLTVEPAPLTCAAEDKARPYGDGNPTLTVVCNGFVNGDDESDLDTVPTATCAAIPESAAGPYPISASGGADGNYSFAYFGGTLTVDPVALTCTADDKDKVFGSPNPALTITYTGLKNADAAPATPPAIACAATAASPVGPYDITLTGGSDPNYTLALVDGGLRIWPGVTMRFWVDDGNGVTELTFGEVETATDNFDPAWDVVADGPPVDGVYARLSALSVTRAADQDLSRDYRAPATASRWLLAVSGLAAGRSAALTWDVTSAAAGREVYLQKIEDEQCVGSPLNMRDLGQLDLTEDVALEVVYSEPVGTKITLGSGWNLVGSPVISTQSGREIFGGGTRAAVHVAPAWHWRGLRYLIWNEDEPLSPERGLWMYCLADGESAEITGVQADGVVSLEPGWNLVSPAADCTMPAAPGLGSSGWYWDSESGTYQRIVAGDAMVAGRGYWLYVSPGGPVLLQLGE